MDNYNEFKKKAVNSLESYLNKLIHSGSDNDLKNVKLLSYWMKDYCNYLSEEKQFKSTDLKRYERGDIIKVNLGYNIGSEEGGLHYCVVWDKYNALSSPVITVIPLTSLKKDKYIPRKQEVVLGDDVYRKITAKSDTAIKKYKESLNDMLKKYDEIRNTVYSLRLEDEKINVKLYNAASKNQVAKLKRLQASNFEEAKQQMLLLGQLEKQISITDKDFELVRKIKKELEKMKKGGIALVGQITTISKMRIYDPKNKYNVLSGIKLSVENLDKINEKFKELYVF